VVVHQQLLVAEEVVALDQLVRAVQVKTEEQPDLCQHLVVVAAAETAVVASDHHQLQQLVALEVIIFPAQEVDLRLEVQAVLVVAEAAETVQLLLAAAEQAVLVLKELNGQLRVPALAVVVVAVAVIREPPPRVIMAALVVQ
jgi:hypothetical protein